MFADAWSSINSELIALQ